jgi:GT2 family glycosyltransferase
MRYTTKDISIIMPSYNTLNYTLMAYRSLRDYYPDNEIIVLDDGSTDQSAEYFELQLKLDSNLRFWANTSGNILGHTVTYDMGIKMARNPIVTIFHSDMICTKNYLTNLLKHWKEKTVVCATRIEPEGIYPPAKEKILKPFGLEFFDFKYKEFLEFVKQEETDRKDQTTKGIFAPWLISKEDFLAIGGHDAKSFAPYPEEDADLFLRFHLAGYELIQSRDSLCWHWISRGHRSWAKNGVGKDDHMFKFYQNRARRNYVRKWHRSMAFDENHHPIKHPVYNIGFVITNVTSEDFLYFIEPWASNIFVDNMVCAERYIEKEQPTTKIDLSKRILNHGYIEQVNNDILMYFDCKQFLENPKWYPEIVTTLTDILSEQGVENNSEFELGIFKLKTKVVKDISSTLIKV